MPSGEARRGLTRRQRVERMAALDKNLMFSILEWGAETNCTVQTVTASILKYPLVVVEGVYKNLRAARDEFRSRHFKRCVPARGLGESHVLLGVGGLFSSLFFVLQCERLDGWCAEVHNFNRANAMFGVLVHGKTPRIG